MYNYEKLLQRNGIQESTLPKDILAIIEKLHNLDYELEEETDDADIKKLTASIKEIDAELVDEITDWLDDESEEDLPIEQVKANLLQGFFAAGTSKIPLSSLKSAGYPFPSTSKWNEQIGTFRLQKNMYENFATLKKAVKMSMIQQLQAAQAFFKESGINIESIFGLFTGKATPKKIAQTVTPLLIKVSPAIGNAIRHLETDSKEKRYLVISVEQDESGRPLEALSECRVNPESGQLEFLHSIPFYQLATYVTDKIEKAQQQAAILELNAHSLEANVDLKQASSVNTEQKRLTS